METLPPGQSNEEFEKNVYIGSQKPVLLKSSGKYLYYVPTLCVAQISESHLNILIRIEWSVKLLEPNTTRSWMLR